MRNHKPGGRSEQCRVTAQKDKDLGDRRCRDRRIECGNPTYMYLVRVTGEERRKNEEWLLIPGCEGASSADGWCGRCDTGNVWCDTGNIWYRSAWWQKRGTGVKREKRGRGMRKHDLLRVWWEVLCNGAVGIMACGTCVPIWGPIFEGWQVGEWSEGSDLSATLRNLRLSLVGDGESVTWSDLLLER